MGLTTKIEGCDFPEDLLYDSEGLMWARPGAGETVVGITTILAALAGRLASVTAKPTGAKYERGRVIGTVESARYFGTLKAPVGGTLVGVNEAVLRKPRVLSESPYGDGWFARLLPSDWAVDRQSMKSIEAATGLLESQISALRVRCFTALPDYDMVEIGTECAAVLVKLNELLPRMALGEVVHIVSDDWTAPVEMDRWSTETGHPVIESRKEGNLYHFLVRRAR